MALEALEGTLAQEGWVYCLSQPSRNFLSFHFPKSKQNKRVLIQNGSGRGKREWHGDGREGGWTVECANGMGFVLPCRENALDCGYGESIFKCHWESRSDGAADGDFPEERTEQVHGSEP